MESIKSSPDITLLNTLSKHTGWIGRISFSPDGTKLATPSADRSVIIWNLNNGSIHTTLTEHDLSVFSAAWSADGNLLLTSSSDNTLIVWETQNWEIVKRITFDSSILCISWSKNNNYIALGLKNRKVLILSNGSFEVNFSQSNFFSGVRNIIWIENDSQIIISTEFNNKIYIWSIGEENPITALHSGHSSDITCLSIDKNQFYFASASYDATIRIYDVYNKNIVTILEGHTSAITCIAFSNDGTLLASKSNDNTIRIWSTANWETVKIISEDSGNFWPPTIAFHPIENILATFSNEDREIRIWKYDQNILFSKVNSADFIKYTTAKIVLVGDSGVGKTGLGWRLAHNEFKEHASTHGQQFWIIDELGKTRDDNTECEAVLWDLAGQHIYRSTHAIFLDDVNLSLILFDPTNKHDLLKGVQFWIEQLAGKNKLPPTVLVGARIDRGSISISKNEMDYFCQQFYINGGYLPTSAKTGEGIELLIDKIRNLILWDKMTSTVTTKTFKRVKEFVLSLKEDPERKGILVSPQELKLKLEVIDIDWIFTFKEMMTAVKHLETHGYVTILQSSNDEEIILLKPEILVDLASSIVLFVDKNPLELGSLNETDLLQGKYSFPELLHLSIEEQYTLIDAALQKFLHHNICFRENLGPDTLVIFPNLIKQKRPLLDNIETFEDVSYIVRGRVENVYPALVVLLGYTPTFFRTNHWQNQAQYEVQKNQICGFRMVEEREGEIELILYYSELVPPHTRTAFLGLFEQILYQREVTVTKFPPISCNNKHRQERSTIVKRVKEGKNFLFCEECGEKIDLPDIEKPLRLGEKASNWIWREEAIARLRGLYETLLVKVKTFRRDRMNPRCFISYVNEHSDWTYIFSSRLTEAGIIIIDNIIHDVTDNDFIIPILTPDYKSLWEKRQLNIEDIEVKKISHRIFNIESKWPMILPILREGSNKTSCPLELTSIKNSDFRNDTRFFISLYDLVLSLYAIPLNHATFSHNRSMLSKHWSNNFYHESITQPPHHQELYEIFKEGKEVFISYAWEEISQKIADEIDRYLKKYNITLTRDINEVKYKDMITKFMKEIGKGKCIVLIISEKYLKSKNCLYELLQIANNGNFIDRIFPIVLDDAKIFDPIERIRYVRYWEDKISEFETEMKLVSPANMHGFRDDIDLYTEIRSSLPKLTTILSDINAMPIKSHKDSNFKQMIKSIMIKLEKG